MNGFYSIWSTPYLERKKTDKYWMHDFELLTFVLSAEMWKKLNGTVSIIADDKALKYLEESGVLRLFNGDVKVLSVDKDINSQIFWAAGKLFALNMLEDCQAMVDLDLVVWKNMDYSLEENDIYVIHREEITEHVYPDFTRFSVSNVYEYNKDWDKNVNPCNTALLCFNDLNFIKNYCDESIHFMKNCNEMHDNLCPMVFAEQRLISIMAKQYNKKIGSIFPFASDIGNQDIVTHIWGHKNILKFNYDERMKFCHKTIERIKEESIEAFNVISRIDYLAKYI